MICSLDVFSLRSYRAMNVARHEIPDGRSNEPHVRYFAYWYWWITNDFLVFLISLSISALCILMKTYRRP